MKVSYHVLLASPWRCEADCCRGIASARVASAPVVVLLLLLVDFIRLFS